MTISKKKFIKLLVSKFPELSNDILDDDWMNSIHLQIGCFRIHTQNAIESGNIELANNHLMFLNSYLDEVNEDVLNAIYVSYLEHLEINSALNLDIPKKIAEAINDINNYNTSLKDDELLNDFLKKID